MGVLRYQPFYCEENIWWLVRDPCLPVGIREVAVLANPGGLCMLFNQRAARAPSEPVAWDYHVVLAVYAEAGVEIWDPDSSLGAPASAASWLAASFPEFESWPDALLPRFRLVEGEEYRLRLCSDRRHMLEEGRYIAPPPPWEPIAVGDTTLDSLLDLDQAGPGVVLGLAEVRRRWLTD